MVIAEALGGSEDEFARMMTRKARALGMSNTTYRNANGLPNDEQITTARDQALLGIAIQERFPKYYRYFSTPSFVYRGSAMRNHNHLLGQVEGVDGIKTGYTRDSGFNLVTSVRRGPRHHRRGGAGRPLGRQPRRADARPDRRAHRRGLDQGRRPGRGRCEPQRPEAAAREAAGARRPKAHPARANEATAAIAPGSTAPITPVKVKTVTVKLRRAERRCDAAPRLPCDPPEPVRAAALADRIRPNPGRGAGASARGRRSDRAAHRRRHRSRRRRRRAFSASYPPWSLPPRRPPSSAKAEPAAIPRPRPKRHRSHRAPSRHATTRGGWAIQVGAYEDEGEAKQKLSSAKSKIASVLQKAEAYIERTVKGAKTYYRARFAGFDRDQAEAACKRLKREDVACMALKI